MSSTRFNSLVAGVFTLNLVFIVACSPAAAPAAPPTVPAAAPKVAQADGQASKPTAAAPAVKADSKGPAPQGKPQGISDVVTYLQPDREQVLLEGAKKEGKLVWYTSHTQFEDLKKAFEAKYPGISVEAFRASEVGQRMIEEYSAGRYNVDVYEDTFGNNNRNNEDIFIPFESPFKSNVVPELLSPLYAGTRGYFLGYAYSPKSVAAADIPKSWQDLLDPKYKGKILMSHTGSGSGRLAVVLSDTLGEDYIRQLARNAIWQGIEGRAIADLIIAGEVPMSWSIATSHAYVAETDQAPLVWVPFDPVAAEWAAVSIGKKAPHPFAAALFSDWLLDPNGGQVVYEKLGNSSPLKGGRLTPLSYLQGKTFKWVDPSKTFPDMEQRLEKARQLMRSLVVGQ